MGFSRFLRLMVYQPSWFIQCLSNPCRITEIVFSLTYSWINEGVNIFHQGLPHIHVPESRIKDKTKGTHIRLHMPAYISTYWMYPLCNGYRRRKWIVWHEFKSWTRLIAFHIALIPLGKVWIQLFSLRLWVSSGAD